MDEVEEDMVLLSTVTQAAAIVSIEFSSAANKRKRDHRSLPREKKRNFRHQQVKEILKFDYLGPKPLFNGREFESVFRVSRTRFQCLLEDFGNSNIRFYKGHTDCFPIQCLALKPSYFCL